MNDLLIAGDLKPRLWWLVKLRWGGILGVLIATHAVRELAFLSFSLIPVYATLGFAASYNLYCWRELQNADGDPRRLAVLQILLDQVTLALAVYFSGGCDSPFIYFFIFHVVISGIILDRTHTFVFAGLAVGFPALVMGLKHTGVLPHYGIFRDEPAAFANPTVVASYGSAFLATIFLTAYFVTYLSSKLHEKNKEVMRLYALSERLRSSIRLQEVLAIIEKEIRGLVGARTSLYLQLDREKRQLSFQENDGLIVPLLDKNRLTEAVLKGTTSIIDSRLLNSDFERAVLEHIGASRVLVLPVMAASLQSCRAYFHCTDLNCAAYENSSSRCWQLSGVHCKGALMGTYWEKLGKCLSCELFTTVGVYVLDIPRNYTPMSNVDMDACMRLLDASGMAVANALLYEKTMELSKTDGLTGLKNHREFKELLRAEFLRSQRYGRTFGLFMIDVDHFKNYNDVNGHPQGDILLKKMAELLLDNFKNTDVAARYGGEEFAVLLLEPGGKEQAVMVAERLRSMVDWCKFPKEESQPGGKVTVSIGVSCYPDDGDSFEAILKAADDALYRAKKEGRNRVVTA